MKTISVFLALLLGTVLNTFAGDGNVSTKDTINGWYMYKMEGNGLDTTYTHLTSKSYEGRSAQVFGYSTKALETSYYWRKDLGKSYLFPKFVLAQTCLESLGPDSINSAVIEIFLGNRSNPTIIRRMSRTAVNYRDLRGNFWENLPNVDTLTAKPDSVNFVVIKLRYYLNKNSKAEFIVDDLKLAYGKGGPQQGGYDSCITIDRFGDSDPIAGKPELTYSPKSVDFGTLKVRAASKETTIVFRNPGNDTLWGGLNLYGKGYSVADSDMSLVIAPMDSVLKVIHFCPETTGKANGYLVIESNSANSPDTVFLIGAGDITNGVDGKSDNPKDFSLSQNYPNPFNPSTTIEFSLPKLSFVNLTIYNMLGQEVKTLVSGELNEGVHRINWNAEVPSGTYIYRLTANSFVAAKKMILIR